MLEELLNILNELVNDGNDADDESDPKEVGQQFSTKKLPNQNTTLTDQVSKANKQSVNGNNNKSNQSKNFSCNSKIVVLKQNANKGVKRPLIALNGVKAKSVNVANHACSSVMERTVEDSPINSQAGTTKSKSQKLRDGTDGGSVERASLKAPIDKSTQQILEETYDAKSFEINLPKKFEVLVCLKRIVDAKPKNTEILSYEHLPIKKRRISYVEIEKGN